MLETLRLFARYNSVANSKLYELLSGQPDELLNRETGSFFHTIMGLLNHILRSDINALRRVANSIPGTDLADESALDADASLPFGALLIDRFAPLRARRVAVDALYERFLAEANDDVLATRILLTSSSGAEVRMKIGEYLLHMFNHATHHRGAISQVLDSLKVENDYSSLRSAIE